jgi:hypothetical protein
VQHLPTFGCLVHVKDTTLNLKKFDDRSRLMIFIGYEPGSKAYRVYNPLTKKVHVTRDIVFAEQEQWNWSVEAGHEPAGGDDTLTVEMEYSTVVQGVSAGDHIPGAPEIGGMVGTPERAASPTPPLFSPAPVSAAESAAGVGDQGEQPGSPLGIREEDLDAYHEEDDPVWVRRVNDNLGPASPRELAQRVLTQELYAVSSDGPNSFEEAEQDPCWRWAMLEEMKAIEDNGTWHLADLPQGRRAIGFKWVFKVKRDERGEIAKHKARLVVKGYAQNMGIDYDEVFAPVAWLDSVRLLIALAAHEGWAVGCQIRIPKW